MLRSGRRPSRSPSPGQRPAERTGSQRPGRPNGPSRPGRRPIGPLGRYELSRRFLSPGRCPGLGEPLPRWGSPSGRLRGMESRHGTPTKRSTFLARHPRPSPNGRGEILCSPRPARLPPGGVMRYNPAIGTCGLDRILALATPDSDPSDKDLKTMGVYLGIDIGTSGHQDPGDRPDGQDPRRRHGDLSLLLPQAALERAGPRGLVAGDRSSRSAR